MKSVDHITFGPDFGFGLYVHWPFCTRICPYCDFNVYAAKDRESESLLVSILDDISRHRDLLPDHPPLTSIYLGGGTPSLLQPDDVERLLVRAHQSFGLAANCEVTLEANPNDVLGRDLAAWRAAGVNRLSVGLQSLNDGALSFLGRDHDSEAGRRAAERALAIFETVSLDMIYARPGQSADDWTCELQQALELGAPHLSLYELTIEERTAFGRRAARGELVPMSGDEQAVLYELTQDVCESFGLPAYEISNHGRSAAHHSRHNLTYWNGGDWIGAGPGAHGRLTLSGRRYATLAEPRPDLYSKHPAAEAAGQELSRAEAGEELLMMGLRSVEGIQRLRVEQAMGRPLPESAIVNFIESGHLSADDGVLKLTPAGRLLADAIGSRLLIG